MHTIHHTRAVILKSTPSGESNKMFWLFTESFGLVVATATGVRKGGAKLTGQLTDYAFVDVDLVQGREIWRLVSATLLLNPLADTPRHPLARSYVRTLATLERFIIGEDAHPTLFTHIEDCAQYLKEGRASGRVSNDGTRPNSAESGARHDPAGSDTKIYDTLAIWRTLVHLGYIAVEDEQGNLFTLPFADALTHLEPSVVKTMVATVNSTITETHL